MSLCVGAHSCWSILNFKIHFSPSCWTFYIITSHLLSHITLCPPVQVLFFAIAVSSAHYNNNINYSNLLTSSVLFKQMWHPPSLFIECLSCINTNISFEFCLFPWLVFLFSYSWIFTNFFLNEYLYAYSINF